MKKINRHLIFSPTDLARFMENPYVTWMNRLYVEDSSQLTPNEDSDELKIIAGMGMDHERAFLARLRDDGRQVLEIPEGPIDDRVRITEGAMIAGQDVIYQGALAADSFAGLSDFLFRVDRPSKLGDHSYEVWDTKLARKAKPYFLIQLCCYAEILEQMQGHRPERIVVVTGDDQERTFRTDDYFFYYQTLKRAFLEQQSAFDPTKRTEPLPEGKNGRWESEAKRWLEETDHLSRVADIRNDQILKLRGAGIHTRQQLADASPDTLVKRMRPDTLDKLRDQARLQVKSDTLERPLFEVLTPAIDDPRRGLALLPSASPLDVAFDIEGYPLVEGGLEYLLGAITLPDLQFHDWWAHNDAEEKASFESFIDWIHDRWRQDPTMHVYHYAAYEVTAMRRLMGKYGTREDEVDDLLRHEVFVDLYKVVHQGIRIGAPSYSLKKVERLYLDARKEDVATAGESIVFYQRWLETPDGDDWHGSKILREIRDYNEVDCISTWKLIDWLRVEQDKSAIPFLPIITDDDDKDSPDAHPAAELADKLVAMIPEDRSQDEDRWRVHELIAWLVEFHRREDKPTWWRLFDRRDSTEDQLRDDLDCLAGLHRTKTEPRPEKRSTVFEYTFDVTQDTKMRGPSKGRPGRGVLFGQDLIRCSLHTMNEDTGLAELKLGPSALKKLGEDGMPNRLNLIPDDHVNSNTISESIFRVATRFLDSGELPAALDAFLFRRRPKLLDGPAAAERGRDAGPLALTGERSLDTALIVTPQLDETTLCIQGPPGTGKTYTGAQIILKLLASGKKVGVTSNSHKAICNLLMKVSTEAEESGQELNAVKAGGSKDEPLLKRPGFQGTQNASSLMKMGEPPTLIGGTAWVFSHEELQGHLDYLFIDEAGQVSVANLVGMSPSARNVVLLGDQMQLGQPTQGSHPGQSGLSCLDYLLEDHATVPDELGIFLGTSWRMHPDVCRFISGAVYEDRLESEPHTANRVIQPPGDGRIDRGSGLLFVPVEHEANRQGSLEEVDVVADLVEELLRSRRSDQDGNDAGLLTPDDILIVAPYNLQVQLLASRLGEDARVGTIDKFQGQEAPVVIVSMAASSGDDSPRGMDFLFDKNRLNVAISRAQSLAVVVGNPGLARTACGTVKSMGLVNLFCRVVAAGS